jgi:hypothetical protein
LASAFAWLASIVSFMCSWPDLISASRRANICSSP